MKYLRFVGITGDKSAGLVLKVFPVFGIAERVFDNETAYEVGYDATSEKYEFRIACSLESKLLDKAYGLLYSTFVCVSDLSYNLQKQINEFYKLLEEENKPACLKCSQNTVLTNRQWLETFTDEEFAVWLESFNSCNRCMRQGNDCFSHFDIEDWLKREHREG